MHTPNDPYTGSNSHNFIYDHVSSDDKEMFSVPDSYHVFIIDKNAPLVNKKILEFIKSH